eukprot:CAMPEP_0183725568 /NCGR_PEP_ID=MMETSP0737-20130205/20758_1 /TAXON_ID=385413 /ORGANISM="Thalassiosira miniscula, Strain CCMP1093" /LENGTH=244 /DNA_ID=CAMNT_0025956591 /DNA_START=213 /DNA_END=947 /DNA_ORIENTATION=-
MNMTDHRYEGPAHMDNIPTYLNAIGAKAPEGPVDMGIIPARLNALKASKGHERKSDKRPSRRLRFQSTVKVQPVDCKMTKDEKSRSHYSKIELKTFSLKVKAIHALSEGLPCGVHTTDKDCMIAVEANTRLRGLELYLCPQRERNKVLAKKALLKYQSKLTADRTKTSEQKALSLASAGAKLSQWARSVAKETARLDSLRAYDGDYLIPIDEPVDIKPFPVTVKRPRRITLDKDSRATKKRRSH